MSNPAPTELLRAVRRRLRRLRVAAALRSAAWVTSVVLIGMAVAHLWVVRFDAVVVLAAAAMPWLVAAGWAFRHRLTDGDCAAWADRHLGGASAYSTFLEISDGPSSSPVSPARERFLQWIAAAVPRSEAALQSLPLQWRLARPTLAMIVSGALVAIVLQLPAPGVDRTVSPRAATTATPAASTTHEGLNRDAPAGEAAARSMAATQGRQDASDAASRTDGAMPLAAALDGEAAAREAATAPIAGAPGKRAAAGGRDAGNSADTAQDPGLSPAWQGTLARRLLSATGAADPDSARADPTRAAAYAAASGSPDSAPAALDLAPAPATAPTARPQAILGPAEQAYVRAYFSGS